MNLRLHLAIPFLLLSATLVHAQDYYEGTDGLTGDELKQKLHEIIRNHTVRSYDEFRDTILPDLDEDPDNSDNIITFYKNGSIPKSDFAVDGDSWNREHTWPSSHGFPNTSDTTYTDVHNLRTSDASVNTSKSNKDFNNVEHIPENEQGEAPDTYTDSDFWEPRDEIKGDVARILFYMDVRYESERLDLEVVDRITFSNDPEIGVLYTLIQWHESDPVDAAEMARHEGAFGYQGNRNPFIDHPEWVAEIWGSSSIPVLALDAPNLSHDFGTVSIGSAASQSYDLNAYNLVDDVSVTVDEPFFVSTDQINWSDSIGFENDDSGSQTFSVFVQFEPSAEDQTFNGTVTHFTDGDTLKFDVTGTEGGVDLITLAEARAMPLGSTVRITGVVIDAGNNSSNNRVIYDGTAGIVVRSFDAGNESSNLVQGDSVVITGGLSEFNELLQIEESPITIELISQGATLPEPQLLELNEVGEEYESELIKVEGVRIVNTGQFEGGGAAGNFLLASGPDILILRIGSSGHPLVGTDIPTGRLDIVGFVGQFGDDYQLSPRTLDDMVLLATGIEDRIQVDDLIYPNPATQAFSIGKSIEDSSRVFVIDLLGKVYKLVQQPDGSYSVAHLQAGVYVVMVQSSDKVFYSRLIKE